MPRRYAAGVPLTRATRSVRPGNRGAPASDGPGQLVGRGRHPGTERPDLRTPTGPVVEVHQPEHDGDVPGRPEHRRLDAGDLVARVRLDVPEQERPAGDLREQRAVVAVALLALHR